MACISPLLIRDPRHLYHQDMPVMMQVPCGHCIGCLRKRQNDWSIRISEELKNHACNCFVTLTYRDECVPYNICLETGEVRKSLRKSDYQSWLKLLRIRLNRKGFSSPHFFVCGEYGSCTFRPHYHIVVCGANTDMIRDSLDYWVDRYGFVLSKDIGLSQRDRQSVGMYVGKYSSKGVFLSESPLMVDFLERPFCEASHFLGLKYIQDRIEYFSLIDEHRSYPNFESFVDDWSNNFVYDNNGFRYSMPTYYKNYFFSHTPEGFIDSVVRKTGFDPSHQKVTLNVYGFVKNDFKRAETVIVPSFRDSFALSLYNLSCNKYRSKCGQDTDSESFFQAGLKLAAEEFSSKCTFLGSETRKLDSFYFKSKL